MDESLSLNCRLIHLEISYSSWPLEGAIRYGSVGSDSGFRGGPKPPPPFRRLSRRSGRIPAEPCPPLKYLHSRATHSGRKAVNSGGLGAEPPTHYAVLPYPAVVPCSGWPLSGPCGTESAHHQHALLATDPTHRLCYRAPFGLAAHLTRWLKAKGGIKAERGTPDATQVVILVFACCCLPAPCL
jgi:hypothetical protein